MTIKDRDDDAEETGEKRTFFRSVPVFALSQTNVVPGVEPMPLKLTSAPIDGDSPASSCPSARSCSA